MNTETIITREEWKELGLDAVVQYAKDGKCSCPKSGHTIFCDWPLVLVEAQTVEEIETIETSAL